MNVVLTTTWTEQRSRTLISWGFEPNSTCLNQANFPIVPPAFWNVHDATLSQTSRTNNFCEAWNNGFSKLVGHAHPSLYVLVSSLQEDESLTSTAILQASRGQPPKKRIRRTTAQLQSRLLKLCEDRRDGLRPVEETLSGLGHNVHLQACHHSQRLDIHRCL